MRTIIIHVTWWCLSGIRRLISLPATTSEVPMKLSRIVVNFGFFSLKVFDANRQRSVAKPSITAPANGDTCKNKREPSGMIKLSHDSPMIQFVLASQLNSPRKPCPCVFVPVPATRRTERTSTRNSRPSAAPRSSVQHLEASSFLPSCLPCGCTDRPWSRPTLATTKRWEGTRRRHKWQHQSCQRLKTKSLSCWKQFEALHNYHQW